MFNFLKPPVEADLLDHQQLENAPKSLNTERQKLSFWIRFVCALALLLSGFGVLLFSYIFLAEMFSFRYYDAKGWYIGGAFLWIGVFVMSSLYAKAGSMFAKITLVTLLVIAGGAIWMVLDSGRMNWDNIYSDIRYMRLEEFVLVSGLYTTGLLVFPAAWFGWRYAQALKIPQLEETDWEWKNNTVALGFKSWRLGALAFIVLGIAWTPIIVNELGSYQRRFERKFMTDDTIEMPYDDFAIPVEEPEWEEEWEEEIIDEPSPEIDDEVVEEE
ncbi:MAG: hypothetical protein AB8E82_09855 [Aureispira sp.]